MSLTRLPTIRSTGKVEDLSGPWERILWGKGAVKRFHEGFYFPSAFPKKSAPPGKHFLFAEAVGSSNQPGRDWSRWTDAKKQVDSMVDYFFAYYADLEDCIEWTSYKLTDPPSILTWYNKPIYRHPFKIETIDGLYMASA